ncbi:MAG: hypothetical protein RLZZ150_1006 [Bacteroidota bacterium]|jgi:isopenicillin-N epimerase
MLNRSDFLLRDDIVFLNHGSFGACPRPILDEQRRWIEQLEAQPVLYFRESIANLLHARNALARYVGAEGKDLVYVTNSTFGVNVTAHALSMMLTEGDEICTTDHEYGACDRAWEQYCVAKGIRYVRAEIPMPVPSMDEMADIIWSKVTPNTKVLFLSHITSPTGVRLPVEDLCARARAAGILSVIDGSHSPGHIPLDLSTLQADVYTANCHKWMCTPKGSAFLWVAPHLQDAIIPLVVSWGARNPVAGDGPLNIEHEFIGTRDYSPFLSVPFAIDLMAQQPWDRAQQHGRGLAQVAHDMLVALPGVQPMHAGGHDPLLQMATVILPSDVDTDHMKQWLYNERAIEVVVHQWLNVPILRCSAHLHTQQRDIDALEAAVREYLTGFSSRESS